MLGRPRHHPKTTYCVVDTLGGADETKKEEKIKKLRLANQVERQK
jgi:hypothetical protein